MWEHEICSIKATLCTTVGMQILIEELLRMLHTKMEDILNAKPFGYISSKVRAVELLETQVLAN